MGYANPQIRASTPHEQDLLDIIARSPDLILELVEGPPRRLCLTGAGIWVQRATLGEFNRSDLVPPVPDGWFR